jgi:hypothetical protein
MVTTTAKFNTQQAAQLWNVDPDKVTRAIRKFLPDVKPTMGNNGTGKLQRGYYLTQEQIDEVMVILDAGERVNYGPKRAYVRRNGAGEAAATKTGETGGGPAPGPAATKTGETGGGPAPGPAGAAGQGGPPNAAGTRRNGGVRGIAKKRENPLARIVLHKTVAQALAAGNTHANVIIEAAITNFFKLGAGDQMKMLLENNIGTIEDGVFVDLTPEVKQAAGIISQLGEYEYKVKGLRRELAVIGVK